ncbi:MAG: NUDIX hydrolase [Chloroflexi bacterium]|nr:NUDIX hydrolase [Chloroflexota bacterium]
MIFSGRAIKLRIDTIIGADGRETTREIVEHPDCIAVIPIDGDGNILLVSQYRKAAERQMLEIPAGGIDPGEDAEEAVRREMREETGFLPHKLERLCGFYSAPGYATEFLHLYLASELTPAPLSAEDTEGIKLVKVPVHGLSELISSGAICDSKSIAGLLFYLRYREGR